MKQAKKRTKNDPPAHLRIQMEPIAYNKLNELMASFPLAGSGGVKNFSTTILEKLALHPKRMDIVEAIMKAHGPQA